MVKVNEVELLRMYKEGMSYVQIGKELGVGANTIMRRIKYLLTPVEKRDSNYLKGASDRENGMYRDDLDDIAEKEMIRLYVDERLTLALIAKRFSCDRGVVKRRLLKNNIDMIRTPRSDKAKDNQPAKNKLFYAYKLSAKKRNISFNISSETFENLINKNCYYCGSEPSQIYKSSFHTLVYNGVDRIDSSKGYNDDNVIPCCKYCNQMKSNMDADIFLNQIKRIHANLIK